MISKVNDSVYLDKVLPAENGRRLLINGTQVGAGSFTLIAGPCAVESAIQLEAVAKLLHSLGAHFLRGGAYKPRTSPHSFQGLALEGLKLLRQMGDKYSLNVVTEVIDVESLPQVAEYADVLQVGARNMQNFSLLRALGQCRKPVLLKRGFAATIDEWLGAADYIATGGNDKIILCERGIRTFSQATRNTLDLASAVVARNMTSFPVIADPSHGTGHWELINPMVKASLAAGLDGVMVEIHPQPEKALSDGRQSLTLPHYSTLQYEISELAPAFGKQIN